MSSNGDLPALWHLERSNFNEKARWALDYKRIPHKRVAPTPGAHMAIAMAMTRRFPTFPVLKLDGKAIGDSTRIIAALEERFPEPPLYPSDPADRRRALELEEFFDENVGRDARRVGLSEILGDPNVPGLPPPALQGIVRRRYGVTEEATAQSLLKVRAGMHLIADLLDGGDHLVGDSFTVADLTAAALLGSLLAAPNVPYQRRGIKLPGALEEISRELRALPAGAWIHRIYERYRPQSAEVSDAVAV